MKARKYTAITALLACAFSLFVFAFSFRIDIASAAIKTEYAVALSEYTVENFDESTTVYAPNGDVVQTENGKFLCRDLGVYTVVKNGKTVKTVCVIYKPFETTFRYAKEIVEEVKTNEKVTFPVAEISTERETYDTYSVRIEKNGALMEEFVSVSKEIEYTFMVSGEYTIVYSVVDGYGLTAKDETVIRVLKSKDIVGAYVSATTCVLNELDFSAVEGLYEGKSYPVQIQIFNAENQEETISNAKFLPTKTGEYKAKFICAFPDETVVKEIPFEVVLAEGSLFSNGTNITGVTLNADTAKKKGLEISASGAGASIYYNQMIDLSNFSSDDRLISFYVPYNENSDAHDIRVTLIDAYDENNQVSVYWKRSKSKGWEHLTYCLVEFNGYALGLNNESATPTPREVYGAILTCSFLRESYAFNITYDQAENAFYTWRSASLKIKLLDLDDAEALKGYKTWSGFSSNYVYMKIDFINNVKSMVQVESIGGLNLKTTGNEIADENYLQFTYRGESVTGQDGAMLTGFVNQNYPLPVPIAKNLFGNIGVDLQLWVNTGAGFVKSTDTVTDFTLKPSVAGAYKAVYSYIDLYGNAQTKTFEFTVSASNAPALNIYGANVNADIMSFAAPPEISVVGGTGNTQKTVVYTYGGETVEPNEDGLFFLDKKGYVEMKVTATDEIGVTAETYFYIIVNNDVRLIDVEEIPLSYIAGREYVLPDFTAIDYAFDEGDDGFFMAKSVYVNGVPVGTNRTFTCPTGVSTVTVRYYGGEGTAREFYRDVEIAVVETGTNDAVSLDNLFQLPTGVSGELFEFGYAVKFRNDISLNYANPLTVRELNISFAVLQNATVYTGVTFRLTDYANAEQSILIEFRNITDKTADLYVNGVLSGVLKGVSGTYMLGDYKNTRYVTYSFYLLDYKLMLVDDARNEVCKITTFENGKPYKGFDSGLVKINVSTSGTTGQSTLVLNGLSNQNYTTYAIASGMDGTGPSVAIRKEFAERYAFGDVISISNAVAYDVLQGKGYGVELTVTLPDGSKQRLDGEKINEITLSQYGTYKFTYVSYDYFGNSGKYEHIVIVKDTEKPQITVNANVPVTLKAGETLLLGDFTASDNVGVTEAIVYVKTPQSWLLRVDGSYTFKETGVYKIVYFAVDAQGNDSTIVYEITVE